MTAGSCSVAISGSRSVGDHAPTREKEETMAKGMALTIGLNAVDPKHYEGWSGKLNACEADANDMTDIARSRKFNVRTLLTKRATRAAVLGGIATAAKALITTGAQNRAFEKQSPFFEKQSPFMV
jgi:hypothetical protein